VAISRKFEASLLEITPVENSSAFWGKKLLSKFPDTGSDKVKLYFDADDTTLTLLASACPLSIL
jgi:hypothetical protein